MPDRPEEPARRAEGAQRSGGEPRRRGEDAFSRVRHASRTERAARAIHEFAGSARAQWMALVFVIAWLTIGPLVADYAGVAVFFQQLVDGLSFMMLFVLQRSQNKDTKALQLKLDELVASSPRASNRVLNLEEISEQELERIRRHFEALDRLSREDEKMRLTEEDAYRRHAEEKRFAEDRSRAPGDDE